MLEWLEPTCGILRSWWQHATSERLWKGSPRISQSGGRWTSWRYERKLGTMYAWAGWKYGELQQSTTRGEDATVVSCVIPRYYQSKCPLTYADLSIQDGECCDNWKEQRGFTFQSTNFICGGSTKVKHKDIVAARCSNSKLSFHAKGRQLAYYKNMFPTRSILHRYRRLHRVEQWRPLQIARSRWPIHIPSA